MSDLRTPDELTTENELICEELLGWERVLMPEDNYPAFKRTWHEDPIYAPSFTTWADAGLILDAFEARFVGRAISWQIHHCGEPTQKHHASLEWDISEDASKYAQSGEPTGPLAIRAAALEYIRSQS